MNNAMTFRRALAHRLLTLLALPVAGGGCFIGTSCPEVDPTPVERCIDWPPDGGAGGSGGSGSLMCPSRDEAKTQIDSVFFQYHDVTSDATIKNGQCCYATMATPYCEGRPYLVDDMARTAPATHGNGDSGWGGAMEHEPDISSIDADLRATLAAEWTRDALFEHASVASFGRFALELLAVGAPAELVEDAHRAALDEVRHARLCFGLASTYASEPIAPGAFPFEGTVHVEADLASIAARTAKEGCIGETIAAVIAAEQLARAEDPAVVAALGVIAADEARHAELAWRTLAWAMRVGDSRVRAAVTEVFADLGSTAMVDADGSSDPRLEPHGRIAGAALTEATIRALDEVVWPAAQALLSGQSETSTRISTSHVAALA